MFSFLLLPCILDCFSVFFFLGFIFSWVSLFSGFLLFFVFFWLDLEYEALNTEFAKATRKLYKASTMIMLGNMPCLRTGRQANMGVHHVWGIKIRVSGGKVRGSMFKLQIDCSNFLWLF